MTIRKPEVSWDLFNKLDLRVGTVERAECFPQARNPAIKLWLNFGPEFGRHLNHRVHQQGHRCRAADQLSFFLTSAALFQVADAQRGHRRLSLCVPYAFYAVFFRVEAKRYGSLGELPVKSITPLVRQILSSCSYTPQKPGSDPQTGGNHGSRASLLAQIQGLPGLALESHDAKWQRVQS